MNHAAHVIPLGWELHPLEVLRRWPRDRPLVMLYSGDGDPRWGRWTALAEPAAAVSGWDAVRSVLAQRPRVEPAHESEVPFDRGLHIGGLGYELCGVIEPAACSRHTPAWPPAQFLECPDVLVFDHVRGRWFLSGGGPTWPLHQMERDLERGDAHAASLCGELRAASPDGEHLDAIERTLEYIRAGDIFQANITRRYECAFTGSPRDLAGAAFEAARPRYGAYLELPGGNAIISMSPELFLQVDGHARRVVTRPIKGTRAAMDDPLDLWQSEKDAAELHMIVDLMRNDLGRVCAYGSVQVDTSRAIETHPTVHHGVAEVSGRLREDASPADLIEAAFPAGSITGAPKIRAMQIISELEPGPRDWYCGSIGFIDGRGNMTLNVGIRTVMLEKRDHAPGIGHPEMWTLRYGAGGGIVADSDPQSELRECEQKTEVLRAALRALSEAAALPRA